MAEKHVTLKEIIRKWLEENGYAGLASEQCGCKRDDLFPCDGPQEDCVAGYLGDCVPETCPADGDCDWHIIPGRRPRKDGETLPYSVTCKKHCKHVHFGRQGSECILTAIGSIMKPCSGYDICGKYEPGIRDVT